MELISKSSILSAKKMSDLFFVGLNYSSDKISSLLSDIFLSDKVFELVINVAGDLVITVAMDDNYLIN